MRAVTACEWDPKLVIVVEDDPDILFLAGKRLKKLGYEPILAQDGVEALRKMIDNPSCRRMVTDFMMPSFGGRYWIAFLERFCEDWQIVVVTSSVEADPGQFVTMPKPVDFENLVQIFERYPR